MMALLVWATGEVQQRLTGFLGRTFSFVMSYFMAVPAHDLLVRWPLGAGASSVISTTVMTVCAPRGHIMPGGMDTVCLGIAPRDFMVQNCERGLGLLVGVVNNHVALADKGIKLLFPFDTDI